ncbi:hypothetical protein TRFO_33054 [Tritrichomonas foetus]|uniref:Uncharacterized protein n=1 Tax=Tritrichomonas foetus TaxID=1144522 RepID=A0A1J4JPF0_9EUKA|nr:hypothetical protein TRFO_33054 [Tritrichomonas foetus]|eukprot:OHT00272.1 hypothetical protein TRFO_33054 [Tritrichomonas foetus]
MSIDFEKFEKSSGKAVVKVCKGVPENLSNENIKQFYQTSIRLLNDSNVEEDDLHRLLIAVCKAVSQREFLDDFLAGEFLKKLPYSNDSLKEQLFDLLYIVASSAPQAFTPEVASQVETILRAAPRKALALLTVYAKNFEAVKNSNWQAMLDFLVDLKTSEIFRARLYCKDYVSLLVYLCQKFSGYRSARLTQCWDAICASLTVKRDETVCLCYYALCSLYEQSQSTIANCTFPSQAVACHLRRKNVQKAALSLLLRLQPNGDATDVISSLVWAAHTEINATYVLVRMASDVSVAQALIRDATWMVQDLPTKVDTMRIFAVVLAHQKLRAELAEKNEAIAFLRSAIELNTPGVLSSITTFVRRLPLTQAYVRHISDFGLLSTFFQVALPRNDEKTIHTTLLFIDTFAKVTYTRDLCTVCGYVSNLIKGEGKMAAAASRVAVDLAQYPKCAIKFQKEKLDAYFRDNLRNSKVKKAATHFLKAMRRAYQEELNAQASPKKSAPATPVLSRNVYPNEPSRGDAHSSTPAPAKKDSSSSSSSESDTPEAKQQPPEPVVAKISSSSSSESDREVKEPPKKESSDSDVEQEQPAAVPEKKSSSSDEEPKQQSAKQSSSENEEEAVPEVSSDDEKESESTELKQKTASSSSSSDEESSSNHMRSPPSSPRNRNDRPPASRRSRGRE